MLNLWADYSWLKRVHDGKEMTQFLFFFLSLETIADVEYVPVAIRIDEGALSIAIS